MARHSLFLLAVATCLSLPTGVRAQLTANEFNQLNKLLTEPDTKAALDKRLRLIEGAIEREGEVKKPPVFTIPVDLKRARIPAEQGIPVLLKRLDHSSEAVRYTMLRMLSAYGEEGKSAAPKVLERMRDDPVIALRGDAMRTLARLDPKNAAYAAAILEQLNADAKDDLMNRAALQALSNMAGAVPKSATPQIAKFRDHRLTELGVLAHMLIGKMHAPQLLTLEQLRTMKSIDWRDTDDQGYAALASIADAGPKAEFATPLVLGVLASDPPPYLESVALDALAKTRTGNSKAITAFLNRITAKDLYVRNKARFGLSFADLKEPASARALAAGLRDDDRGVRLAAAVELRLRDDSGRLPPAAHAEILKPLLETLAEVNDFVPLGELDAYLMLLRRFGTRAAAAGEGMVKLYQSEAYFKKMGAYGDQVRGKLLAVLANIGVPESGHALVMQALKKGPTNQTDGGFAYAAAARAAATFAEPKEAMPLLLPGLNIKGPEVALYFIDWSGDGIGKPTTVRVEVVRALGKLGPGADEALPILRELAEKKPDTKSVLDLLVFQEARRAYSAIAKTPLPPTKGIFADGKKETLNLDERLNVKMILKLRNPRPQDILNRLEQATKLKFTMDENVNPDLAVWGSSFSVNLPAWMTMRNMANAPNIQGHWEDVGDGYRLLGKKRTPEEKLALIPKVPHPPFKDDSFDPLPDDPRLNKTLTIRLSDARAEDVVQLIRNATGVPLTIENVDPDAILWAGINFPNTPAHSAMRSVAENPRVKGSWEKVGDGYRLRGTIPPAVRIPRPIAAPANSPVPSPQADVAASHAPMSLFICFGIFFVILAGAAILLTVCLWGRKEAG